ncbi:MAG TPA: DUF4249 domain-containing protein [Chitinophaga sp.]|uniref:DUF4249 domain-containing protein n=1 Tax=Chitinophaga sp. TaxID=1869181 RepID=UPI002C3FF47C|nr:DUF4249 domain-containing protein [Chitinophaga sp.]HVI47380.1 DUF4249 domain-containing protein [Chitinophaga sp.]
MRNLFTILIVALALSACEKKIDIHVRDQEPQLVVEGRFENDRYPQVLLTRSLNYFSKIDPQQLLGSLVHNALVTVSDGNNTMNLKETFVDVNGVRAPVYMPDTTLATTFKGKRGGRYVLRISTDNKSYESVTTIPLAGMVLDSVKWQRVRVNGDTNKARILVKITDPPEQGNYIRYFTKRNNERFLPGLNSVYDDQVVNGTTFEIPLEAGVDKNKSIDIETMGYFDRGDTITLKFCNIDKATYDFWRTMDFAFNSNSNPFSSPTRILGNVPGALGYWGGYAVTYKRIVIRK